MLFQMPFGVEVRCLLRLINAHACLPIPLFEMAALRARRRTRISIIEVILQVHSRGHLHNILFREAAAVIFDLSSYLRTKLLVDTLIWEV